MSENTSNVRHADAVRRKHVAASFSRKLLAPPRDVREAQSASRKAQMEEHQRRDGAPKPKTNDSRKSNRQRGNKVSIDRLMRERHGVGYVER